LKSTGAAVPTWSAVNLASTDVSGTLAIAKGGTGSTTAAGALTNLGALGTASTAVAICLVRFQIYNWCQETIVDADINATGITTAGKVSGGAITSAPLVAQRVSHIWRSYHYRTGSLSMRAPQRFGGINTPGQHATSFTPTKYLSTDNAGILTWATVPSSLFTSNIIS